MSRRNGALAEHERQITEGEPVLAEARAAHERALATLRHRIEETSGCETPVEVPSGKFVDAVRRVLVEHGTDHCGACRDLAEMMAVRTA